MKQRTNVTAHSGYITTDKNYNSNLFFIHLQAKVNPDKAPLLLWLQGGPGKSALFGLFLENGPLGIDAKGKLYRRQTTLRNFANVIYLDQPAGSGFSFTASSRGFAETLEDCSLGIKEFLRQFLIMFPEYKGRNFFAAGESYGARTAMGIVHQLQTEKDPRIPLNIRGVIAGVGFLGPTLDIVDSSDFLFHVGMLDEAARQVYAGVIKQIRQLANVNRTMALLLLGQTTFNPESKGEKMLYTKLTGYYDHGSVLTYYSPSEFNQYIKFVMKPRIKKALHVVPTAQLDAYRVQVSMRLGFRDLFANINSQIQEVLDSQRVLIYTGQMDAILPAVNLERHFKSLNWTGAEKFRAMRRRPWYASRERSDLLGYVTSVNDLTYVMLTRVGHHPSFDNSAVVYKMTRAFVCDMDLLPLWQKA